LKSSGPQSDISESICEAVLERYAQSDDSIAQSMEKNHIEVRDFMILSFVSDQNEMRLVQLMQALGLSFATIDHCVERLVSSGLVVYKNAKDRDRLESAICPTGVGRSVCLRIHNQASAR